MCPQNADVPQSKTPLLARSSIFTKINLAKSAVRQIEGFVTSKTGYRGTQRFDTASADVRFGSTADACSAKRHVRFTPESGHDLFDDIVGATQQRQGHV